MKYIWAFEIIVILMVVCNALVHYKKLPASANGCTGKGGEIKVGEVEKDDKVCGVVACQNKQGDALIHYCQRPVPFQDCSQNGVSTVIDFPQCCWTCVNYHDCDAKGGAPASRT